MFNYNPPSAERHPLTYLQLRKLRPVHEGEQPGGERHVDPVPLLDEAVAVAPVEAHLAEGLPERRRGEALDAGQQPDLVEDSENSFAELVANVVWGLSI